MNTELFLSGILALAIGVLFEVLTRVSKSKPWLRARVLIVLGIVVIAVSVLVS
jgi:hypothetical protein